MRAATFPESIHQSVFGVPLAAGVEYLLADIVSRAYKGNRSVYANWQARLETAKSEDNKELVELLEAKQDYAHGITQAAYHKTRDANQLLNLWRHPADLNGKKLLFTNGPGLGDFLMLYPAVKKIKALYPGVFIGTACHSFYTEFLKALPLFDEVIPYPAKIETVTGYDYHVNYESMFELDPRANELLASRLFAEKLGLELSDAEHEFDLQMGDFDGKAFLAAREEGWTTEYREWFNRKFTEGKQPGEKWIGLFLRTSAQCRNWRPDNVLALTHFLIANGYQVFWLGRAGDGYDYGFFPCGNEGNYFGGFCGAPSGFHNFTGLLDNPLQLSEFVKDWIDLIITPDSFAWHLGGILKKPTIGLFGPIPTLLRMSPAYKTCIGLSKKGLECAPCFAHNQQMPCGKDWCEALASITPNEVLAMTRKLFAKMERAPEGQASGGSGILGGLRETIRYYEKDCAGESVHSWAVADRLKELIGERNGRTA